MSLVFLFHDFILLQLHLLEVLVPFILLDVLDALLEEELLELGPNVDMRLAEEELFLRQIIPDYLPDLVDLLDILVYDEVVDRHAYFIEQHLLVLLSFHVAEDLHETRENHPDNLREQGDGGRKQGHGVCLAVVWLLHDVVGDQIHGLVLFVRVQRDVAD